MRTLNAYLRDLLFLHDCVILPGFGGFVGSYQPTIKTEQNYFTPPRKAIAFNPQLKQNDGLLANTIVEIEEVNYAEAMKRVESFVLDIQKELRAKGFYMIPTVGKLERGTQDRILFTPDTTTNFLLSPLGASAFQMAPLVAKQPDIVRHSEITEKRDNLPMIRRVLVASVSGFALLSLLLNPGEYKNLTLSAIAPTSVYETSISAPAVSQKSIALTHTEVTANKTTVKNTVAPTLKKYHVIVGCFSMKGNAEFQQKQLAAKNIEAIVFPYSNKMTGVSVGSYETFEEAKVTMNALRNSGDAPSAWVLKRVLK
ncbi:sporulation related protein [Balneicella halophila]|uniref:Sporulation related protein n=1 Tax=Balneicella halophila TaxID=1537566 RepID=A0A7L4UQ15_BALHA|nr:SPOR domain-containing protein [Balneicella halophila]PVX51856.1 sporulation related protein [Balneicella halophila]